MIFFATSPHNALCQSTPPPPRLETIPSPPPVDQPFDADVYLSANPSSIAFYNNDVVVAGNIVTVKFNSGCGFICPGGGTYYGPFRLHLPALSRGSYTLRIIDGIFPTFVYAEFSLGIGLSSPIPLPAYDRRTLAFLIALMALLACAALRKSRNAPTHSTTDSGNVHD
jgi:hypothetical protein